MRYVGTNGCKAGWIAVALDERGEASHTVAAEFAQIAAAYPLALILVDVPIGLRDSGPDERLCDKEARRLLGARASSVFPAPCRSAIWQPNHEAGSLENLRQTGRKLSAQSWAIVPKIRQLEEYLRFHSSEGPVVREIHPEVCFWGLAGRSMQGSKHAKDGVEERLSVLAAHCSGARDLARRVAGSEPRSVLSQDDVLDALVGAVTAFLGTKPLRTLPDAPEIDSRGLRMEMVYAPRS